MKYIILVIAFSALGLKSSEPVDLYSDQIYEDPIKLLTIAEKKIGKSKLLYIYYKNGQMLAIFKIENKDTFFIIDLLPCEKVELKINSKLLNIKDYISEIKMGIYFSAHKDQNANEGQLGWQNVVLGYTCDLSKKGSELFLSGFIQGGSLNLHIYKSTENVWIINDKQISNKVIEKK